MTDVERLPRFTDPSYFASHPWLEYGFIASAMMSQLVVQSASTNALPLLSILQNSFDTSQDASPWFMASVGLGIGTLILPSGSIGDKYGLKESIVGGYAWSLIWTLLSGISYYVNSDFFIVCRTFQGCGLAFVVPNMMGALGRVYTPRTPRKNMIFSFVGLCAPFGGAMGTLFSGIVGTKTDRWDWAYYALTIFIAAILILAIVAVPHVPPHSTNKVDWIGSILGVTALTLFNFAWNQAPVAGWDSPYIIVLLIVGFLLFPVFIYWELTYAQQPLLPPEVLHSSQLLLALLCMFAAWGSFGIKIYSFVTFLGRFRGYIPVAQGAAVTPAIPAGACAALICGLLISHGFPIRLILLFATLAFLGSDIIIATLKVDEMFWRSSFGVFILAPFGMDWSFPAASILMSDTLPPNLQGLAGSLVNTAINYGISLWLGIGGNVEKQLSLRGKSDLEAWRGQMYFSIGSSSLAVATATILLLMPYIKRFKRGRTHCLDDKDSEKEFEA